MKTYKDRRTGDEVTVRDEDPPPPPQPCMVCRGMTLHATLVNYGRRCFGCYEAYCSAGVGGSGLVKDTPAQAEMRKHVKARA